MSIAARCVIRCLVLLLGALAPVVHAQEARPSAERDAATRPVVVFAAASLKNALDRIAKDWEGKTGRTTTLSFAASSALAKQLEAGAPADLFLSADLKWMDWAAERNLIDPASRRTLLGNTLVLVAPRESAVTLKIEKGFALADALGEGRLAMGEPASVPAGIYGKEALTALGVWDSIASKVAGAENVRVALTYVARGETPLGIVYATDAKSEPQVRVVDTFPADSHAPVVYPIALTAGATHAEARTFLDYLSGPEARTVFESHGFTVLTP